MQISYTLKNSVNMRMDSLLKKDFRAFCHKSLHKLEADLPLHRSHSPNVFIIACWVFFISANSYPMGMNTWNTLVFYCFYSYPDQLNLLENNHKLNCKLRRSKTYCFVHGLALCCHFISFG